MNSECIDHVSLTRLVEAGIIPEAHIIGQPGGWGLVVKYGRLRRPLAASRSLKIRLFKRLEALVGYLKTLGIDTFDVDAAKFDPCTVQTYTRPDRAAAMRQTHEAPNTTDGFARRLPRVLKKPTLPIPSGSRRMMPNPVGPRNGPPFQPRRDRSLKTRYPGNGGSKAARMSIYQYMIYNDIVE